MTDKRERQYQVDSAELDRILSDYQNPEGHCEINVKVQNGFVVIIEDVRKRKPAKVA